MYQSVCSKRTYTYDITLKKIPAEILDKIGQPTPRKGEALEIPYYDLTPYGIEPLE